MRHQRFISFQFARYLVLAATLVAVSATIYGPWVGQIGTVDHDALATLGELRALGGLGMVDGGFFQVNLLLRPINAILNLSGLFKNHYLLAYQVLVWLAVTAQTLICFALVARWSHRSGLAFVVALVLLTLPGMANLMSIFEDNLVSGFLHVQYIAAYLWLVELHGGQEPLTRRQTFFVGCLFPISLLIAAVGHRQYTILWITPAALYFFLRSYPRSYRLRLVGQCYLIAVTGLLLIFGLLTIHWDGAWRIGPWLRHIRAWVLPIEFYYQYYFFNEFGWNFALQGKRILKGVMQIFAFPSQGHAFVLVPWFLLLLAIPYRSRFRLLLADPLNGVLFLFILIHVPHSLIYESWNIERWDPIMVPMLLIVARNATRVDMGRATGSRYKFPAARHGMMCLFAAILLVNVLGYREFSNNVSESNREPMLSALMPRLTAGVLRRPASKTSGDGELILVLSRQEYDFHYLKAEAFHDYKRNLFILDTDGEIRRNQYPYPMLTTVATEAFARRVRGNRIVADAGVAAQLRRLPGISQETFADVPDHR